MVDLRLAFAVAVLELIVGGASGRWTVLPGGFSGRMLIDSILGVVSLIALWRAAYGTQRMPLGRYGLHAAIVAVAIPAVWVPIGIVNGFGVRNAISDGDGFLFFALALVLAAVALRGDLGWLRRWILACSVAAAAVTIIVFAAIVVGAANADALEALLVGTFDMGGLVDSHSGGTRVYLASGLFLQVGAAIVAWELLHDRRRAWPWLVTFVLAAALVLSFTRGYWLGATVAAGIVVLFGRGDLAHRLASSPRLAAGLLVGGISVFLAISLLGAGGGLGSNLVKLYQAVILTGHFLERPFIGWGLGAVAPNYFLGDAFTYEITYLDRAFKLGALGLIVFLSLPLRLLLDSVRVAFGRLQGATGMAPREGVVAVGIIASVMLASATNPYMVGSVGIGALVLAIAWLDPFDEGSRPE